MRDPLMPEKSSEQSQKQKRWVMLGILALGMSVVIIGRGKAVWRGSSDAIRHDAETQQKWLGV